MMKHLSEYAVLIVACVLTFIGGYIGYNLKQCKTIGTVSYIEVHDTQYITSSPIVLPSKPINKIITVPKYYTKYIDTNGVKVDTCFLEYPMFTASDTLTSEFGKVVIKDTGDCSGVIGRTSIWDIKQKVITNTKTVTNTITIKPPYLSLYGGVSTSMNSKYSFIDIAPNLALNVKGRYHLGYGYLINGKQHLISIQTKIK